MNKWTTSLGTSLIDFSYMSLKTITKIYQQGTLDKHSSDFYLLLGDLHGNIKAALILAIRLQTLFQVRLKAIFQVGDFGFWPTGMAAKLLDPHYKKEDSLDLFEFKQGAMLDNFFSRGQTEFERLTAPLYFIRGNHEDFAQLNLLSPMIPSEVITRVYYLPDYFRGVIEGLRIAAVGGILIDLERGRGKKAKMQFKKAQQKIQTDPRRANVVPLIESTSKNVDLLLTHSGLGSRENRDGSRQLETYLSRSDIPLHIHGHHHRFVISHVGLNTLSIGLRNLEQAQNERLIPGSFALLNWKDRTNFVLYSDVNVN